MRSQITTWELLLLVPHLCFRSVVATTGPLPRQLSHGYYKTERVQQFVDVALNAAADKCQVGSKECGDGCIPELGSCCDGGRGWCSIDSVCVKDGCCDIGKVCTKEPGDCLGDLVACGTDGHCIPPGTICCPDTGYYCNKGETCAFEGFSYCETGSPESSSATKTATSTSSQTSSTSRSNSASTKTSTGSSSTTSTTSSETNTGAADGTASNKAEAPGATNEPSGTDTGAALGVTGLRGTAMGFITIGLVAVQLIW